MGFKTKIRSEWKYWQSRYENLTFPRKLVREPLALPDSFILDKATIGKRNSDILPYYPDEKLHERLAIQQKVKTVAVIFNSGILLENNWGDEIDSNDLVIRINFLPTKGYERHTGSRTDIRILGRNWIFREGTELAIHTYNNELYAIRDKEIFEHSLRMRDEKFLYVFDNSTWEPVYTYFGANVSNGLRAVLLALTLAETVKIYGADQSSKTWRKGKKLTHFPSEKDLEFVQQHMLPYALLHQEYERYFGTGAMKEGKVSTIHNTINREYMFYDAHPAVYSVYGK